MNSCLIQKATEKNLKELQEIATQTFYETFAENNSEEDMKKYLKKNFCLSKLNEEMKKASEFYFAVIDTAVVGYLKVNFRNSQTELKDKNSMEVERIYVLKKFQKNKIGQLLLNKAIEIAKKTKADFLWLGVWDANLNAINFYKKNGFREFDKHIFVLGEDKQTDIMMKLNIKDL